jgi:aldose 1-epimerase
MTVVILHLGAIIQRLIVPDRNGRPVDVALGMETESEYLALKPNPYFGAIIGRVSNRIVGANFTLDGVTYNTSVNDKIPAPKSGPPGSGNTVPNVNDTIHGGVTGFTQRMWSGRKLNMLDGEAAAMNIRSSDGDQGFPGNVDAWVIYKLLADTNRLETTFLATTDKATPISLTSHAYFNLDGHNSGKLITDHIVKLDADYYTPDYNNTIVPTGQVASVSGTAFDLRKPTRIADVIDKVPSADVPTGYDINYVTRAGYPAPSITQPAPEPVPIATITGPATGITMNIWSNAPGFEWYTGNHLPGPNDPQITGKGGAKYVRRGGFAVEPQNWPMSVKHSNFPSTIVRPGQIYEHQMIWDFSAE